MRGADPPPESTCLWAQYVNWKGAIFTFPKNTYHHLTLAHIFKEFLFHRGTQKLVDS